VPLAATIDLPERYRVVRHIASGGMASVWEVEDLLLGRLVAVKVLGAQFAADPGARERFQREARTAAQVSDQTNVVTIYDIGEYGDDAFIVMEHFAGGTVADRLRAARDAGERVPRETALRWLREAATGLDVAHAAGIVHRDVKPANLLLDAQDRLAVGDFGIARLADDTQMTMTGQVLGTAAYISPEQALGQPATDASDRYALAVVAYELLTGSRPFAGGPPTAQARQHAEVPPAPASQAAPGVPPSIDGVLARGLAKDPGRRPRSAGELVAGIEAALDESAGIEPTRAFAAAVPVEVTSRPRTPPARAPRARLTPSPPPDAPRDLGLAAGAAAAGAPGPSAAPANAASVSPSAPGQRRPPWPLIGATAVVAATIALVLVLAGGRDDSRSPSAHQRTSAKAASRTATTAAAAPKPAPAPAAPKNVSTSGETPSALNERGHALLEQGRYGEAIAPLRAAVQGYKDAGETGLPYAFALYNLAVALNRSGNPGEAIPLLRERLQFDNQRKTVQAELDNALAKVGGTAPEAGNPPQGAGKAKGKKGKRD
jgi:serine/threonine-protein kinase